MPKSGYFTSFELQENHLWAWQRLSDFLDEYEANVVVPSSTRGPSNTTVWSRGDWTPGWYRPDSASLGCSDLKLISTVKFGRLKPWNRDLGLCLMRHQQALWMPSNIPWNRVTNLECWRLNEIDVCVFFSSGLLNLHFNPCLKKHRFLNQRCLGGQVGPWG